jgi:hypothetical protein
MGEVDMQFLFGLFVGAVITIILIGLIQNNE